MNQDLAPVELREWGEAVLDGYGEPGPEDLALQASLGERGDARLELEWSHDGSLRVRSRSWVGVVRLEHVEVRIRPKYAGGDVGLLRMLDYSSGVEALRRLPGDRQLSSDSVSLVDLICLLLVEEAEKIIRNGVLSDYVTHEEALSGLRGRLLLERQVAMHYGQVSPLECRHDEWEADIIENRIVAAGLRAARHLCGDAAIRSRVARTAAAFSEVCQPDADEDLVAESRLVEYHRRNAHYRSAHQWALILISHHAVDDLFAPAPRTCFAFLLDMNVLFERFVARLLTEACRGTAVRVSAQARERTVILDAATHRSYTSIRPDLLVDDESMAPRTTRAIDTKYKLYDNKRIDVADLYQSFLYAYAFHRAADGSARIATLVYPSDTSREQLRLLIQSRDGVEGAVVRAVGIDLIDAVDRISRGEGPNPDVVALLLGAGAFS